MNEVCSKFDTIRLNKSQSIFRDFFPHFSIFGIQIQKKFYPPVGNRPVLQPVQTGKAGYRGNRPVTNGKVNPGYHRRLPKYALLLNSVFPPRRGCDSTVGVD
jgi:hypothetical protein